eukprot:1152181-Pelagomonas_calceolata.AAC.4
MWYLAGYAAAAAVTVPAVGAAGAAGEHLRLHLPSFLAEGSNVAALAVCKGGTVSSLPHTAPPAHCAPLLPANGCRCVRACLCKGVQGSVQSYTCTTGSKAVCKGTPVQRCPRLCASQAHPASHTLTHPSERAALLPLCEGLAYSYKQKLNVQHKCRDDSAPIGLKAFPGGFDPFSMKGEG